MKYSESINGFHYKEDLLRNFIKESLNSRPIPLRKPRNGDIFVEVRQSSGLIKKFKLKESYIVKVLGIKKKRLMESINDSSFHREILKEHLLLEGWWSDAKEWMKEKVKDNPITNTIEAAKEFGEGISGATAALTAIVSSGGNAIETVVRGAKSLMGKGVQSIRKSVNKVLERVREVAEKIMLDKVKVFVVSIAEKIKNLVDGVISKIQNIISGSGWKIMLTIVAIFLAVKTLREKVRSLAGNLLSVLSGDAKEMLAGAKALYEKISGAIENDDDEEDEEEEKSIEQEIADSEKEKSNAQEAAEQGMYALAISYIWKSLKGMIWGLIKKVIGEAGIQAIESLSGPVGWIKKLGDIFQKIAGGVVFVCEGIMEACERASF